MSPFEYVIVLISIILGLGITTILTGVAELIKHTRKLQLYGPYMIWLLLVFVLHIQEWWHSYALKSIAVWKLPMFLFILLYPINLYVLAHLLFPADLKQDFDAKEFYLQNYPRLFISAIIIVCLSIIHNIFLEGYPVYSQGVQFLLLALLSFFVITKNKNSVLHTLMSVFMLVVMLVILLFTKESLLSA
ncbi:MAG: hypothetical protein ACOYXT_24375 [Bacteroidota bacterium]